MGGEKAPFWTPFKSMARLLLLSRRMGKNPVGINWEGLAWVRSIMTGVISSWQLFQHYWNELALSVWPLAEQLLTKPRNLSDSLGTAQAQTHVAPNFPLSTEGDFSWLRALHTSCCSYLCCTFLAGISHHNSWLCAGNILYFIIPCSLLYVFINKFGWK